MKTFLAVYMGSASALEKSNWNSLPEAERRQREQAGIQAWSEWMAKHHALIDFQGGPLGKTKRVGPSGSSDIRNAMTGFVVLRAESHEAAARLFENHPHFTLFPGEAVEIMECLPVPGR